MIALLRALSIGDNTAFHEFVESVLAREGIERLAVSDFKQALWFASPTGVDLIVIGTVKPEASLHSEPVTIENGAFGAPAPPVIVWTGGAKVSKARRLNEQSRNAVFLAARIGAPKVDALLSAGWVVAGLDSKLHLC